MLKVLICLALTGGILVLPACKNDPVSGKLITVDLNKGLKNKKEFRLSEVAKSVEYIPLETNKECLFSHAGYVISKNYVMVYQYYDPCQLLLFDRSGKFLRKIGNQGKGPGEYISMNYVYAEPDERWILVYDYQADRIMKYGFDGKLITEMDSKEKLKGDIDRFIFLKGGRIAVLFSRPTQKTEHYPLVRIVDYDFNILEEKFFVSTEALNANGWATGGPSFYLAQDRLHLREFFYDTLYVETDKSFKAQYYFKLAGIRPPAQYITFGPQGGYYRWSQYASVLDTESLGDLLFLTVVAEPQGEKPKENYLVYNTRNQDLFSITDLPLCTVDKDDYPKPAILNDLDGYLPLRNFERSGDMIFRAVEMLDLIAWKEKGCEKRDKVKLPQKQAELTTIIQSRTINDNPVLQVFQLK